MTGINLAVSVVVALLAAIAEPRALAEDLCPDEVTLNKPGMPFGMQTPDVPSESGQPAIPVRSQGDRGICYGYASAELVDAWRYTHSPTRPAPGQPFKRSSPVVAAVNASIAAGEKSKFEGGNIRFTVNNMLKEGVSCDHDFVFSTADAHSPAESLFVRQLENVWDEFMAYMHDFRRAMDLDQEYKKPRARWTPEMLRLEKYHLLDNRTRNLPMNEWWTQFFYVHGSIAEARKLQCRLVDSGVPLDKIPAEMIHGTNAILARLMGRATSKLDFIHSFFAEACKGHQVPLTGVPQAHNEPPPPKNLYYANEPGRAAEDINRRLSLPDRQPVAISFCPAVLDKAQPDAADQTRLGTSQKSWYTVKGTAATGYSTQCDSNDAKDPDPHGGHAVLVIGRRKDPKNGGKCQFLLRNSWGTGCFRYLPAGWTDCHNGEVWVDAATLSSNIMSITYLQK